MVKELKTYKQLMKNEWDRRKKEKEKIDRKRKKIYITLPGGGKIAVKG